MNEPYYITMTVEPSLVGQRVRATSYGGKVSLYMAGLEGTVVRFTRKGNPVVELDHSVKDDYFIVGGNALKSPEVSDVHGCFRVLDSEGKLIREEVEGK